MTDALDRSLLLAAAMDSRGYGRTTGIPGRTRRLTGLLVITGLAGICVGTYGLLDATAPRTLGLPMLLLGVVLAAAGFSASGRRIRRSRYRPDPWQGPEWTVLASGAIAATSLFIASSADPAALHPTVQPLTWPTLPLVPTLGILVGALPAFLAPRPVRSTQPDLELSVR